MKTASGKVLKMFCNKQQVASTFFFFNLITIFNNFFLPS